MEIVFKGVDANSQCEHDNCAASEWQKQSDLLSIISVAQPKQHLEKISLGIYDGMAKAGFAMLGREAATKRFWIIKFMVDGVHQGNGYTDLVMRKLLKHIYMTYEAHEVFTSYRQEDDTAERISGRMGFKKTGEVEEGEAVALKKYDNDQGGQDYMCKVGFARCNYCMSCKWAKEGRLNEHVDRKSLWNKNQ